MEAVEHFKIKFLLNYVSHGPKLLCCLHRIEEYQYQQIYQDDLQNISECPQIIPHSFLFRD
jgi:hypothetical protein